MTKINAKFSEALALLLVIALAPVSIAFAQTTGDASSVETKTVDPVDTDTRTDEQKRKDKLNDELKRLRENIADRKSKIIDRTTDKIRDKIVDKERSIDRVADLKYGGKTSGWAILGGTAFPSSIAISGVGHNQGNGNWKITAVGDISVADRTAKLDMTGHVRGNMITLQGTGTLSDGTAIKIHIKGHYAATGNTGEFAIAFTNSHIQYMDNGARMPLMQVGSVMVTPVVTPVPVEPVPAPTTPAQ
jgi:hypothetical protein